jgi:hypothetical protein
MNDETVVTGTIELVQGQIRDLERNLTEKKRMVNSLLGLIGQDPIYASVEPTHTGTVLRSDEFYGKALTSVVRTILDRRNAAELGAASTDSIYDDMLRGGYQFDAKSDMTAKRSLAISLAKNSYLFHRLPNDDWGLVSWYPNIPTKTKVNGNKEEKEQPKEEQAEKDGLNEPYHNQFAEAEPQQPKDGAPEKKLKSARKLQDEAEQAARMRVHAANHPEVQAAATE